MAWPDWAIAELIPTFLKQEKGNQRAQGKDNLNMHYGSTAEVGHSKEEAKKMRLVITLFMLPIINSVWWYNSAFIQIYELTIVLLSRHF